MEKVTLTVKTVQPALWMGVVFTSDEVSGEIRCQDYLTVGKTYTGLLIHQEFQGGYAVFEVDF